MLVPSGSRLRMSCNKILALHLRRAAQVCAFQIQNIERVIEEAVLAACLQVRLEAREARNAGGVLHHDFAVEQRGAEAVLGQRLRHARESLGPVEAIAGEKLDLFAVDARLRPVAIEFDLVNPPVAGWGAVRQGCQAWLDERGKHAELGAANTLGVR